jgi:Group 4 capsule polysaccharide lipoprotein gfcB, YjbF
MASPVPIARRLFLAGGTALFCTACGDTWLNGVTYATKTYLMKGADLNLTRADIDRIPYASIAVRLGDGPQALLILARYDGDDLHWVSAERKVIVTRRGRVVQTYGLPVDLKETAFLTADPVGRPVAAFAAAKECLRTIDLEPRHIDGVLVRSRFAGDGRDDLVILGEHLATSVWSETSAAAELDWNFTNRYWVDAQSGFVWRSLQYVSPRLPALEIIVYRPAVAA